MHFQVSIASTGTPVQSSAYWPPSRTISVFNMYAIRILAYLAHLLKCTPTKEQVTQDMTSLFICNAAVGLTVNSENSLLTVKQATQYIGVNILAIFNAILLF